MGTSWQRKRHWLLWFVRPVGAAQLALWVGLFTLLPLVLLLVTGLYLLVLR